LITPITDKSTSKPILSNFVLEATEGDPRVKFSATDYEISIQGHFEAKVEKSGSVCISARKVLEVCREFLSEDIEIESDPQLWVNFLGGSAKLRLPSMDVGLYPTMEEVDLANSFSMGSKDLKRCIDLTIFATQTQEARKNLMGVCLSFPEGHTAKWTATDGHRLAQVSREVEAAVLETPPEIIIPRKSLSEMVKVLEKTEEKVKVSFDERTLKLTTDHMVVTTRLIEGKFPNVEQVIPRDSDKTISVERERLSNGLRIVSFMSADKIKPVKLTLQNESMKLESEHSDTGESTNEIEVSYAGDPLQIGFNAKYILDVLSVLTEGDKVELEMKGPLNPCKLGLPGDDSFLAVVMPLRIEW